MALSMCDSPIHASGQASNRTHLPIGHRHGAADNWRAPWRARNGHMRSRGAAEGYSCAVLAVAVDVLGCTCLRTNTGSPAGDGGDSPTRRGRSRTTKTRCGAAAQPSRGCSEPRNGIGGIDHVQQQHRGTPRTLPSALGRDECGRGVYLESAAESRSKPGVIRVRDTRQPMLGRGVDGENRLARAASGSEPRHLDTGLHVSFRRLGSVRTSPLGHSRAARSPQLEARPAKRT